MGAGGQGGAAWEGRREGETLARSTNAHKEIQKVGTENANVARKSGTKLEGTAAAP